MSEAPGMKLLATITNKEIFDKEIKFNGKYSLRTAARAIVLDKNNNIAILHTKNYGFHKLPGGGVKSNENIANTLRRELIEEIGCEVEIIGEIGRIIEIKNKYKQKQIFYCYIAKVYRRCDSNST